MEFGHRHGDARRPSLLPTSSSSTTDGYFATQASLLAGAYGGRGRAVGPRSPAHNAMHREVREEETSAMLQEATQRRILREEGLRRELELERPLTALPRRAPVYPELLPDRPMPYLPEPRVGERPGLAPLPHRLDLGPSERLNQLHHRLDVGFGDRLPPSLPHRSEIGFGDRLPPQLPHHSDVGFGDRLPPSLPHRSEVGFGDRLPPHLPHHSDVGFGDRLPPSLPHRSEVGFGDRLPPRLPHHSEVGFGDRLPPQHPHHSEVGFGDRLPPPLPHLLENGLGERLPPSLPHHLENGLGGRLPPSLPRHMEVEFDGRSLPHHLEVGFGERLLPSLPRRPEFTERPPSLPCPNPVIGERPHVLHAEPSIKNKPWPHRKPREQEVIILTKGKMPKKLTGIKRKIETIVEADDILQPAKKSWSCSLCEVSATCEQGLKEHLQGKKHKAMEGSLETNIITAKNSDTSTSLAKEAYKTKEAGMPVLAIKAKESDKPVEAKVAPSKGPAEKKKGQKQEVQQEERFWCEVCKVKCNSQVMLDSHLNGKKHKAQVEHPPKNKKPIEGEESHEDNQLVKHDKPVEADESGKTLKPVKDDKPVEADESGKTPKPVKDDKPVTKCVTRAVKKVKKQTTNGKKVTVKEQPHVPASTRQ